jgi:type VI secretion system secreted protein Hcp
MAVDITIKIAGIDGESKVDGHVGEIDVLSWNWGMSQTSTSRGGAGAKSAKVSIQDLTFTKYIDKSSPTLYLTCWNGTVRKDAVLNVRKAGEKPLDYLTITMSEVIISSVSPGGSGGEEQPTENVTLNFVKVTVDYQEQEDKGGPKGGKVTCGWDITKNVRL